MKLFDYEESYYPFGMSQHYSYQRELSKKQRYTYNGKESITDLDLDWLDFGARMYQADLGRWFNVDPLAEKYHDMTPYKYGLNNPVAYTDPNGMTEVYGVDMDLGATGSVQNVFDASPDVMKGKNRYESYDDFVDQVGKEYIAELQATLSNSGDGLEDLLNIESNNDFQDYDHPGKIDIVDSKPSTVAVHLVKGLRYYLNSNEPIDLNTLYNRLNSTDSYIEGTHYTASTRFKLGGKSTPVYLEIPIHGTGKGIDPYIYQTEYRDNDTRFNMRWGKLGILISVPVNSESNLRNVLGL